MNIGSVVINKCLHMGVPKGQVGIVFEDYGSGYQIIWKNGEYCGYGHDEAETFFSDTGIDSGLRYNFTNVIQLSNDYRNRVFDNAFATAERNLLIYG